jgi:serine/threonine-protein kinase
MYCRKCGTPGPDDSTFCEVCGTPFHRSLRAIPVPVIPGVTAPAAPAVAPAAAAPHPAAQPFAGTAVPGAQPFPRPAPSPGGPGIPQGVRFPTPVVASPAAAPAAAAPIAPTIAASAAPESLVGQVIGGAYRIDSLLGSGGMATVYRGTHVELGHPVAIKVMASNLVTDRDLIERFRQEARIQARLRHPNIVGVHHFAAERGMVSFVMELVEGPTLDKFLVKWGAPLDPGACLEILGPVFDAVGCAHAAGVIHRDLKPSNIILGDVGGRLVPKLTDFGIAKVLAEGGRRTATGMRMGTLWYMAPEQFVSLKNVDHRADIYSLGIILYEMLARRVPFDGDSEWDVVRGHIDEPPPPPRVFVPSVSPAIEEVVLRALAKAPADRFSSVSELHGAFASAAGSGVPAPGCHAR